MLFTFTALCFLILGRELSIRFWRDSTPSPFDLESLVSSLTIAFAVWLGSLWILAITGLFSIEVLVARLLVVGSAAAVLWMRRSRASPSPAAWPPAAIATAVVPLALWVLFILIRGWIVPPLSHDALAYHLPKAALYASAERYDPLPDLPARARNIPVNYELMLAEILVLQGNDALTEWPSVLHYLFFIAAGAALAGRWWKPSPVPDATVALVVAAVPVALLHSGAHKNDLMTAAFMTAALVWLGRFVTTRELRALILCAAAIAMAAGTKPQAAVLGLVAMPFAIAALATTPHFVKRLTAIAAASVLLIAILGGGYWIVDRMSSRAAAAAGGTRVPVSYGDWENVWQVPYVLVKAPFSASSTALRVPWAENPWFWRRYEIYFSEAGVPFALAVLAIPIAWAKYRRLAADRRAERIIITIVALATFAIMMPIRFRPLGFYAISAPRYVLFIVPVVLAWSLAPFLRTISTTIPAFAAAAVFVVYAALNGSRDAFVPLRFIRWAAGNPGTRVIPFDPNRSASLVDRAARQDDTIAIEAADGTWLYPAFGRDLTREVRLLPAGVPVHIAPEVDWVVIDRKFTTVWKHPQFENLSQTGSFIARGVALRRDDPLFAALERDRTLRLVHYDGRAGQAVFRRTGSAD